MEYKKKYVPDSLSKSDKEKQKKAIEKSKKQYKESGKVETRPKLKSFKSKESTYTQRINKKLGEKMTPKEIAEKIAKNDTHKRMLIKGFQEIISKGKAAYASSGSRPNQTPMSWGRARLYSVLLGGPARKIDKNIVEKYDVPKL